MDKQAAWGERAPTEATEEMVVPAELDLTASVDFFRDEVATAAKAGAEEMAAMVAMVALVAMVAQGEKSRSSTPRTVSSLLRQFRKSSSAWADLLVAAPKGDKALQPDEAGRAEGAALAAGRLATCQMGSRVGLDRMAVPACREQMVQ